MNWGNQHESRKVRLLNLLHAARGALRSGLTVRTRTNLAQDYLVIWRAAIADVPASTRRRWRCGR